MHPLTFRHVPNYIPTLGLLRTGIFSGPSQKLVSSFEKSAGVRNVTLACLFEHIKVGQGARGTNASGARALTLIPASRICQPTALLRRSRASVKSTHMTLNSHAHTREHFCCTLQVIRPRGIERRGPT